MRKFDLKIWGIRVRKVLVISLVVPLLSILPVAQQPAYAAPIAASDGTCVQDVGSTSGVTVTRIGNDCIVVFTSRTATTWKAPTGVSSVRYLVVGGGASGDRGICGPHWGHGGGGGQVKDSTLVVSTGTNYTVAVGAGGAGSADYSCPGVNGNNGSQSQFASVTAAGGFAAVANSAVGGTSGAGLLGGDATSAGSSPAGGGGGAGTAGSGLNGGSGINSNISGSTIMYGSGGAGRNGGGFGTAQSGGASGGTIAIANRGGGGSDISPGWNAGADGVVVISYLNLFTVTFDSNGASSGSPSISSVTQATIGSAVTLAARGTLSKGSLTFAGWNTQADGKGTNYTASSSFTPTTGVTLYAQWNSVISYDGNTATSTRAIESTTATSNQAATTLSQGRLVRGSPISNGLVLNLDAADASTVSGATWTNKVSGGTSATIVGSPTYNAAEGAFTLNGSSQYFDLGNTAFNFSGTQNYTINVAFKNNEPMKDSTVFSRYNGGVAGNYVLRTASGKYLIQREVSPWEVYSNSFIDPSQINYLSAVYNGSTLSVFVNGAAEGSIAMTGSVGNNAIKTLIGARQNNSTPNAHLNGKIYSVQVYNRALSSAEISTNYQALIPDTRVVKDNFTLGPWNSAANGTGTSFGTAATDLSALPTPYLRLQPANYTQATKTWANTPGSGSFTYRGTPELIASNNGKFGATGNFPVIGGTTSASIYLENPTLTTYTLCVVARYRGLAASPALAASQGRLINGKTENWISGYYGGGVSQFHHNNGWNYYNGSNTDLNWHYHCDSGNKAYWDGVKLAPWTNQTTTYMPSLGINAGWAGAEFSDWELADLIVYDQFLPDAQIEQINRYFKNTYGILAGPSSTSAAASVSPSTTYASSGDTTLFANWGSAITYDGNKQSSGTPPTPSFISGASGALATNSGSLARAGYRFDGWNTAADGSGIFYAPGATYSNTGNITLYAHYSLPVVFPTQYTRVDPIRLNPYMRFKAEDYNVATKLWRDSSGNGRNTSLVRGTPSVITTTSGNGNSKVFQVVSGGTSDGIKFNNPTFSGSTYTLITVARYSGATKQRIFDGDGDNYLHGFFNGKSGVAHHNGWVTTETDRHGSNWVLGTSFASNYRSNGSSRGTSGGTSTLAPLGLNFGTYYATQSSNFEVAEVLIFNYQLSAAQIAQVEDYLSQTYGLTLSSPGSYPTSTNLAIAAGVGGRSETLTALNGRGNKTFTFSPSRTGFSLDTTTANSVALVISPVVASGTYNQTITATELGGETATYLLNVTVSPSVKFDTSTATTIATTHRKGTSLRLNTVFGVGTKVFTMTPIATGITLDTSTAASGFATLRIDTFTATGTFTQVITVTDDTKIKSTYSVTININAPPTLSSNSAIVTSPVLDSLRLNLDAGDLASYSGSGNTWTDLSGNSRNGTLISSPSFTSANGGILSFNGTSQYVTAPSVRSEVFTVEAWVKFNALNNNYACVVTNQYSADKINYSICFWNNSTIRAGYHQNGTGWIGGQTGAFSPAINTWYQLVYKVEKIGVNYIGSLFQNGNLVAGQTTSTIAPGNDQLVDRIGVGWNSGLYINGSIPVVRIYNRALSTTEITQNYNALLPRFTNNPTNSITITTTESVTASSSIYYAGLGTGNKTFALSNATAGISIDTATANTVRLNLANTLSATSSTVSRSISQVITATDTNGISAASPVYVTSVINPKIIITDATPGTITTTFGRSVVDTFTATYGTGNKTFTGVSSAFPSAFTVTNPSTNIGVLTIANNLPVGTYTETITATDTVGAITIYVLTVVVNPAPTIAGTPSNTLTTTIGRTASLRVNVIGGSGNRTITWTSPATGITIDTSTVAAQNYLTLNVSAAVFANTYSFSLTATDSTSAQVTGSFTVVVNKWPRIADPTIVSGGLKIHLDAGNSSSYSGSGTTWTDLSSSGKNGTWQQSPTYRSASGGSLAIGSTTSQYMSSAGLGATNVLTAEAWVKFNAIPANDNCIITDRYTASFINFSICFRNDTKIYGGYWNGSNGWVSTAGTSTPVINTWYHFAYTVSLSGSTYTSILYQNGVAVGNPVTSAYVPGSSSLGFLVGTNWRADTTVVNGDIAVVRVYGKALTAAEVRQNYNVEGFRFASTNSGTDSATVTQGAAGAIRSVTASEGTGTKTFVITNANAGVTIDTGTSNAFTLNLSESLTSTSTTVARTITETVTATDAAGATTARAYTITVNPPIIETATSTSLATTSGVETTTVVYATQGTGNKTFTFSGASSGFTLTSGVNQATLRVLSTANPGTYTLTVTATDALGATTALPITVVVSPPPTLIGISRIETTRGVAFTSPQFGLSGGTGSLTVSVTNSPSNSNITLSGTTSSGTFLVVGESSTVGTFLSTIRVTDARGSFSELIVTVVVNAPVTLSGALSITKTYGDSTSNGYSTNGTGTAPFSFSATPVCAVVKTVSGSYTYERINGTDSCTWTAPVGVSAIDALLVGAGGGGGGDGGAGGGGGSINTLTSVTLPENRQLAVQVGTGGSGGIFQGPSAAAGGATTLTSGATTFTAPGGGAGGGCGSAATSGGSAGVGGSASIGGAGGFGSAGTGCSGGAGSVGTNGPSTSFTGSSVTYGGGGGGGVYPTVTTTVGPNSGGNGGGGRSAASKDYPISGLVHYFRTFASTPTNATSKERFTSGTCAVVVGNVNYTNDNDFPCAEKNNFQGFATGFFIAPVSGSITFYLASDDSSDLVININGTNNELQLGDCCRTVNTTWSGFVAGQAYPIDVFFTEVGGLASWVLSYSYSGVSQTPIPLSQLRSSSEGLAQYFRTSASAPASATSKQEFTSGTCSQTFGAIAYTTDSEFPCAQKDNFQAYATGFFIAPITGSIKFYLYSDDSSLMSITVNGTTQEFSTPIGEASATYSGFVQGQYYPIKVFFSEGPGLAIWKLDYEFSGQSRISIPVGRFRSTADFTASTQGTNGLGGGGGGGTAGFHKLSGAPGGSGTMILKYLTQSETATQTMITAIVNQQSPSGLLTLNVPAYVNVGTYFETITVQDAANSAPYQAVVTVRVNKATPTLALSLPGSVTTAKYGSPVTVSATSPVPGRVVFVNGNDTITACSNVLASLGLATCSWTPTAIGATTLKATLIPTDTANYNNSNQTSLAVTVSKADTFTVTVLSQSETYTGTTIVANRAFTTTGLASIDSLTAISMLFAGTANDGNAYSSATAPTNAGIYSITPNFPTNAAAFTFGIGSAGTTSAITNYESFTVVAGTLTVIRKPQTMVFTFADSNTVTYSPTATLASTATTRLGTGTRTYSSTTPITCSISDSAVVTVLQAGSCGVQMAVALTDNFESDTATRTITINKGSRTLVLTPSVGTLKYSESTTVVATLSGGADDGVISYSLGSPAGCSFDPLTGELIAISGTIQCPLTAIISEGVNYLAETSTAMALTIARANAPVITIDTVTALDHIPNTRALITPTFSVSGLKNSDTADTVSFRYAFVSNPFETFAYSDTRTPIDAGTYSITPSALTLSSGLMSNYETPTYASSAINFVLNRISQETITVENTNGEIEVPFALKTIGGSTNGTVSFAKVSGEFCTVSSLTLTATQAGNCVITVTMTGNRNYLPITSETITVRVRNFVLVQIFVPSNPVTGITITPGTPLATDQISCTSGCVPKITGSDVYEGAEGDLVILTGTNFATVTKVYFNIYTEAPNFVADSDTQISVRVPADLPLGDATIEVVSPGGTSNRYFDFTILP
jgi:uncharacterized repeat protein (TIGR02543 family)